MIYLRRELGGSIEGRATAIAGARRSPVASVLLGLTAYGVWWLIDGAVGDAGVARARRGGPARAGSPERSSTSRTIVAAARRRGRADPGAFVTGRACGARSRPAGASGAEPNRAERRPSATDGGFVRWTAQGRLAARADTLPVVKPSPIDAVLARSADLASACEAACEAIAAGGGSARAPTSRAPGACAPSPTPVLRTCATASRSRWARPAVRCVRRPSSATPGSTARRSSACRSSPAAWSAACSRSAAARRARRRRRGRGAGRRRSRWVTRFESLGGVPPESASGRLAQHAAAIAGLEDPSRIERATLVAALDLAEMETAVLLRREDGRPAARELRRRPARTPPAEARRRRRCSRWPTRSPPAPRGRRPASAACARSRRRSPRCGACGARTIVAVPLSSRGEQLGALIVDRLARARAEHRARRAARARRRAGRELPAHLGRRRRAAPPRRDRPADRPRPSRHVPRDRSPPRTGARSPRASRSATSTTSRTSTTAPATRPATARSRSSPRRCRARCAAATRSTAWAATSSRRCSRSATRTTRSPRPSACARPSPRATPGVTVSVGVAVSAASESDDSLVGRADRALYRAKGAGRNGVAIETTSSPSAAAS